MALEVKVYREVTAYQPKVIFGLSWRQVGIAALGLPALIGLYLALYAFGMGDLGVVLVSVCAIPLVALGWLRPMGVPFEKYAGYWWQFRQGRKRFIYDERTEEQLTKEANSGQAQSRRASAAFEKTN